MATNDKRSPCCICGRIAEPGQSRVIGKSPEGAWIAAHEACIDASYDDDAPKAESPKIDLEATLADLRAMESSLRDMLDRIDETIGYVTAEQAEERAGRQEPPPPPRQDQSHQQPPPGSFRWGWDSNYDPGDFSGPFTPGGSFFSSAYQQQAPECLRYFGLKHGATRSQVNERFRDMAKAIHPDKGGDPKEFVKLKTMRDAAIKACGV